MGFGVTRKLMQSRLADGTLTPGVEIASIRSCSKTCPASLPCWNPRRWDSAASTFRWARRIGHNLVEADCEVNVPA